MKYQVHSKDMLQYLQEIFTSWLEEKAKFGDDDRIVRKDLEQLLGCKSMVENLIGVPVNLQKDGKVTWGY